MYFLARNSVVIFFTLSFQQGELVVMFVDILARQSVKIVSYFEMNKFCRSSFLFLYRNLYSYEMLLSVIYIIPV
jgi:hypothetical protein